MDTNVRDLHTYSDASLSGTESKTSNGSIVNSAYNRFFGLHRLQIDCICSLVQLGRCNFGQKENIGMVLKKRPDLKKQLCWGLRKSEHEYFAKCVSVILKIHLNKLNGLDLVFDSILLLLKPFVCLWPGESLATTDDFMELDGDVLRLQSTAKNQLKSEINAFNNDPLIMGHYKSMFSTLGALMYETFDTANDKLLEAITYTAVVCLKHDTSLEWWSKEFYPWGVAIVRCAQNSKVKALDGAVILSGIFLARNFFKKISRRNDHTNAMTSFALFCDSQYFSQLLQIALEIVVLVLFNIPGNDDKKIGFCIKGLSKFSAWMANETFVNGLKDQNHKCYVSLIKHVCVAWEKSTERSTLLKQFFSDINKFSGSLDTRFLREILRRNICKLAFYWRQRWDKAPQEQHVSHVYGITSSLLNYITSVDILCPLVTGDNEQTIVEILVPTFYTSTLFNVSDLNMVGRFAFYDAIRRDGLVSVFVCFSRLNYSTNRHIEKLLRSAVQVILDNAKAWQNSAGESAVCPSDPSCAEKPSIKEAIAEALDACQQKINENDSTEKAIRLKKFVFNTIL